MRAPTGAHVNQLESFEAVEFYLSLASERGRESPVRLTQVVLFSDCPRRHRSISFPHCPHGSNLSVLPNNYQGDTAAIVVPAFDHEPIRTDAFVSPPFERIR